MKFKVPFCMQESYTDCGPIGLKMILEYFGEKYSREELSKLVDSDKSGITWTIGIARAAAQLGFKTEFYTTYLGVNPKIYELEFIQRYADSRSDSKRKVKRLIKDAVKLGVKIEERSLSLSEILSNITEDCIPLIGLDWGIVDKRDFFIGHLVPIVGYTKKNIYVHNPSLWKPYKNMSIQRNTFESARKSSGTDEEIVYIHRK